MRVLTVSDVGWEKLSTFLNFLVPKLPAPKEDDRSAGILDVDCARVALALVPEAASTE